eukprot:TRINITY_DN24249_c0_g1_i1.p1 TRINITY_DN24249_c0_g1~~TRINITY_DN24249_c0_g1_i1.p1  ORF type:complete len:124 (-),score=47.11 TRINITY_DN24249_c0_g1_i1:75-422(-)
MGELRRPCPPAVTASVLGQGLCCLQAGQGYTAFSSYSPSLSKSQRRNNPHNLSNYKPNLPTPAYGSVLQPTGMEREELRVHHSLLAAVFVLVILTCFLLLLGICKNIPLLFLPGC